jgi:hypothetical protein
MPSLAVVPPARQGLAVVLQVQGDSVVMVVDGTEVEMSADQAHELGTDLQELSGDARGAAPAPLCAAELRARLDLIGRELAAMDRGDKRATDVLRLARELTSEVRGG